MPPVNARKYNNWYTLIPIIGGIVRDHMEILFFFNGESRTLGYEGPYLAEVGENLGLDPVSSDFLVSVSFGLYQCYEYKSQYRDTNVLVSVSVSVSSTYGLK